MLSFLDHTRERQPGGLGRKAHRCGDARYDKRSDRGVWYIYREYAERGEYADEDGGVK